LFKYQWYATCDIIWPSILPTVSFCWIESEWPSSKLRICESCSSHCKDAIVQSGDFLEGNFDFKIPNNPINVFLEKTIFKLPGDGGSTLVVFKEIKKAQEGLTHYPSNQQLRSNWCIVTPKIQTRRSSASLRRTGLNENNPGGDAIVSSITYDKNKKPKYNVKYPVGSKKKESLLDERLLSPPPIISSSRSSRLGPSPGWS